MFNNELVNIEKKAMLITLAHLSNNESQNTLSNILVSYPSHNNKKLNYFDKALTDLLIKVSKEHNINCTQIKSDSDILDSFANLSNNISVNISEEQSSTITAINSPYINLLCRLRNFSDLYTLTLKKRPNITKDEKTLIVLVRHLIDNIITQFVFDDGLDLLNFMNGTRIITDILSLDTTLYNDPISLSLKHSNQ